MEDETLMCSRHAEAGAGMDYVPVEVPIECEGEEIIGIIMWAAPEPAYTITSMFWAEISSRASDMARWNMRLAERDTPNMAQAAYENARRWNKIADYALSRLMRRFDA